MEGHKVLVNEMTSTLATIARDVKIQVEFNPATVQEYRLIGYENRLLNREDFNNDKVDAGDIGAGHTVTALYELTLVGSPGLVDPLRYGPNASRPARASGELAHVKLRYKELGAQASKLIDVPIAQSDLKALAQASQELRFASAVAGFGQILRGGQYTGNWSFADARTLAAANVGQDRFGYRGEFLRLVDLAQSLSTRSPTLGQAAVAR
jgi:Ca-activated chloride channel family protein